MTPQRFDPIARPHWRAAWLLMGALGLYPAAQAAVTDVAQVPLSTSSSTVVKPNIMFILDSSGSMASDFMPDDADFSRSKYGFFAAQCNGLAYNPNTTYVLPVTSTGTNYPAGTFTFPTPATLPNQYTITSAAPTIATGSVTVTINNNNANYTATATSSPSTATTTTPT